MFYKGKNVINSQIKNIKKKLENITLNKEYNNILKSIEEEKNQLKIIDKTDEYNLILSDIEKNKNQMLLIKNSKGYNDLIFEINKIKDKINLIDDIKIKWNPITDKNVIDITNKENLKIYSLILLFGIIIYFVFVSSRYFRK